MRTLAGDCSRSPAPLVRSSSKARKVVTPMRESGSRRKAASKPQRARSNGVRRARHASRPRAARGPIRLPRRPLSPTCRSGTPQTLRQNIAIDGRQGEPSDGSRTLATVRAASTDRSERRADRPRRRAPFCSRAIAAIRSGDLPVIAKSGRRDSGTCSIHECGMERSVRREAVTAVRSTPTSLHSSVSMAAQLESHAGCETGGHRGQPGRSALGRLASATGFSRRPSR